MNPGREIVVIGLLGTTLDAGPGKNRWGKWRPTVSIFQHDDLFVSRLELLYSKRFSTIADRVIGDIGELSPQTSVVSHDFPLENPWDFEEVYSSILDFAQSYPFRPEEKEYWIHISTGTHVAQICLFLLTESRFFPGKLLQTSPRRRKDPPGALAHYTLIDLDLARYDTIATRFEARQREATHFLKAGIETRSEAFNRLIDRIEKVAMVSKAPVLLVGPTGAGKSHLARRIYALKKNRRQVEGPLVEVNCATLRGDSAMSALFGHIRGAFTGADARRQGLLLSADGGLLFLDEIGELGLDEQAMLLRAIEEKRFLPVGGDKEVASDFQLICGTNRDLRDAVKAGRFREDLLARINLWTFSLPGLADRREDVAPNLAYELEQFARRSGRRVRFNKEAQQRFLTFATSSEAKWLANFRDLNAAVTRMATLADGGRVDIPQVEEEIERLQHSWSEGSKEMGSKSRVAEVLGPEAAEELDRFDRIQLEDVLAVCSQSRSLSAAGRVLFAKSRTRRKTVNDADRLRKYLARFELTWAEVSPG